MKTRTLGPNGPQVSNLGFGIMRLPVADGKIDREQAKEMLTEAWESGVNYWDTGWTYHNGDSEVFLGEIFADPEMPDREEITLATKLPSWLVKEESDLDMYFNAQLERLQTDYIDVYLLHTLNAKYWKNLKALGVIDWIKQKKAHGQVKYIGFSFHDSLDVFLEILNACDWDVCQIQYNFMDENEQAGRRGLRKAAEKGVGVIIMEPLQGGNLVVPPKSVADIWKKSAYQDWSQAERALRWIWDQKEVSLVLSGMSTMEQVKENCAVAANVEPGNLDESERQLYTEAREAYLNLKAIGCTGCRYCLPCPQGVDIPWNFRAYNLNAMHGNLEGARGQYQWMKESFDIGLSETDSRGEHCVSCGLCETRCPQNLKIATLMPEVAAVLNKTKDP